jgi:predicted phosphodiesterase
MRVAVLSDIHSNLVALDAVIATFDSIDAVWHLGDVVGYGPDPDGVVGRLKEVGATGVRGNHDAAAIGGDEIDWFNPDAKTAMEWTRRNLSTATLAWLRGLTPRRSEGDVLLVHGSPRDPTWEYITSVPVARANLAETAERYGVFGHTHVPMVYAERDGRIEAISPGDGSIFRLGDGRALINPGSVGQPRDGNPLASYAVLDTEAERCTWHRVAYRIDEVRAAMAEVGLPARLAERLRFGL